MKFSTKLNATFPYFVVWSILKMMCSKASSFKSLNLMMLSPVLPLATVFLYSLAVWTAFFPLRRFLWPFLLLLAKRFWPPFPIRSSSQKVKYANTLAFLYIYVRFLTPQRWYLYVRTAVLDIPRDTLRSSQNRRLSEHFCDWVLFDYVNFIQLPWEIKHLYR